MSKKANTLADDSSERVNTVEPSALPASDETRAWVEQRQKAGNWFDVLPDDDIPADIVASERTVLHMFQLAFAPEIRRRIEAGLLEQDFRLHFAQLLQPSDCPQIVRLNDEVRGVARLEREKPMVPGEAIYSDDLGNIVDFDLVEDDLNCGHFTFFWVGATCMFTCDFRHGRATCAQIVEATMQFLNVARYSATQGYERSGIDKLFSACELLSRAQLILDHSPAARSQSHSSIHSAINLSGKLGNVDGPFLKLFNKMSNARTRARYNTDFTIAAPTEEELGVVDRMALELTESIKQLNFRE